MNRSRTRTATGTKMSKRFLKRLDAGVLLDRTKTISKHQRPTVKVPREMKAMNADYDYLLEEPDDSELCEIHDVWFVPRRGVSCPQCRDDAADRALDIRRDEIDES